MVFALATHRSHENFSAFTHIKYRQLFSDIKRENQKWRKIGSVAMKIKKSILSNFFSIESTSKISHLRYEKLNFSSQNHRIDVNFFDYENWEQYLTFLFYTSGPQLPISMRKIALLLKNGQKSSFFDEFKTWSKKISISEGPEKNFFGPKKIYGGLLHCKTWILVTKIGTSVQRIKVKSASEVSACFLRQFQVFDIYKT